ncbi:MAG: hypothetical protein IJ083_17920 [Clostridia bacterium]|nr:hypothetical protein [Clostridia bacterium]
MNQFADTFLTVLLGWLRSVANMLYTFFAGDGRTSVLEFLGEHWKVLAISLCLAGIILDLVVYFARWRSPEVWKSFFRRRRAHSNEHARVHRERQFAQTVRHRMKEQQWEDSVLNGQVDENLHYIQPENDVYFMEEAQQQDPVPMEPDLAEDTQMDEPFQEDAAWDNEAFEPEENRVRHRRADRTKKKLKIPRLLVEEESSTVAPLHYEAPKPAVDVRDSYGEMYIPPQWKAPEEKKTERHRRSQA